MFSDEKLKWINIANKYYVISKNWHEKGKKSIDGGESYISSGFIKCLAQSKKEGKRS